MGLTIHYDLTLKDKGAGFGDAAAALHKMRQLALDLPFADVGDVIHLAGEQCKPETHRGNEEAQDKFDGAVAAAGYIKAPWNDRYSWTVDAEEALFFAVTVGDGCEPLLLGLAKLPETVEREYKEEDDQRYEVYDERRFPQWNFDFAKWQRKTKGRTPYRHWTETETRRVPVKRPGWAWGACCKTQYASDPACGGAPNFLRCHIAAVTLLERVGRLPGLKCVISDEGEYGPHSTCPDWREADAAGRKRKYVRSAGKKSPKALAAEVVTWNEGIAAMFGGMADALGGTGVTVDAPIQAFQNFEQLEFKGRKSKDVGPFLEALAQMGK